MKILIGLMSEVPKTSIGDVLQVISIFILFIVILLGAYYTTKILGKHQLNKNANMSILEVISVGPGKTVQLIKVGEELLLIGVSKERIVFLKEVKKEHIDFTFFQNQHQDSFQKYYTKILDKMKNKDQQQ